jgi:hypothetical protein
MMKRTLAATALAIVIPLALVLGCTQMPTEKQSVSDMRPQISFKASNAQLYEARVVINGLDMGNVGLYLDGASALRIVAGTHQLRVMQGTQVLLDEKFYAGDGVNRSFIIK